VRSPYGYHIIKVTDVRPSVGKIQVAHIMKNAPPGTSDADIKKAETEINSIYKKLNGGESFWQLAEKYSDHRESAARGGVLNWFGTGEMIPEFSEAAFSLTDTGSYTKPFRTVYGWHIVKLLKKQPVGTFEETRSFLESRINQSYISAQSRKTFSDRLKKEYRYKINSVSLDWFIKNTDSTIMRGIGTYDPAMIPDGIISSFADRTLKNRDFAAFVEKRALQVPAGDPDTFIRSILEASAYEQLTDYENSVLEKKYPDFRYLMKEFHDGILLFDISNREVWDRVNRDSTGMKNYYERNKYSFLSEKEISAKIYTLRMAGGRKELDAAFGKFYGKPDADKLLESKFNRKNDSLLVIKSGKWKRGDNAELDAIEWTEGPHPCEIRGYPSIVLVQHLYEAEPLPLAVVRDKMMTGFQEYLENEWTKQLNEKYDVKIDSFVLGEIKKNLINE
jgi:peptidyl-prolyl cis-trans isomerase SurA